MKNDKLIQLWVDEKTDEFIKSEAQKNQRTKQGQLRYWLLKMQEDAKDAP